MAPKPITAKIDLKYPIYACDFDPRNHDFLLVGGGGGESRSGVPNKITLLNTSRKTELSEVVDIELTNKEDNVQTLAYAQSTDQWATALAGINSSQADQQAGKNEHLRSFLVEYPPKRKDAAQESKDVGTTSTGEHTGHTKALGRIAYFTPSAASEKLTYQRVLRLSKKVEGNGPRLGVIATGLAPEGEIVVFVADTSRPGKDDVRARLNLGDKIEAADVDIMGLEPDEKRGDGNFRVAYCTDYDVLCIDVNYTYNRPGAVVPQNIYGTGHDYAFEDQGPRPKFRCLRLLTPTLILVLQNLPKQKGSEVLVMELTGAILARKRLHKKIKSATGLSVATLPYPENYNHVQHAIAVAGADRSITILTLDHPASSPYGRKLAFRSHTFLPNVHDNVIVSLNFSEHHPPDTPYISAPTQYLKLASTSMVNTCVVHTFILPPYPAPTSKEDKPAYLLNSPSKQTLTQNTFSVLIAILAIAIGSFFLQAFTEIRGGAPEYLGAKNWLSPGVHDWVARPYMFEDGIKSAWSRSIQSEASTASSFLSSVVETPSSVLSSVVETPSSVLSSAGSSVTAKTNEGGLNPILAQATSLATSLASAASSLAVSAWSQAGLGASMVSSSASEEISGASSVLSEAASSGSSSLSESASKVSSKASKAVSKSGSAASSHESKGSSKGSSASSRISSEASKATSKASSAASSPASKGSSKASSASSDISNSASSASSKASSTATHLSSSASTAISSASTAAASVVNAISASAFAAASSAASIAATDAAAEPLASSASEIAASASSLASSAASAASASASGGATKATAAAADVVGSASSAASAASSSASGGATAATSAAAEVVESATQKVGGLRELLKQRGSGVDRRGDEDGEKGGRPDVNVPHEIVVSHVDGSEGGEGGVSVETHPPERVVEREMEVRRWEDLDHTEKASWRKRLHDAGEYTLEETETVLKGVLFSGLGNLVGAALGG